MGDATPETALGRSWPITLASGVGKDLQNGRNASTETGLTTALMVVKLVI
jgi:hypothetical protein